MDGEQTMPSLMDRRRLKDRIIENISKAVKQIQEFQFYTGPEEVIFRNKDRPFCKLVEHLDHVFLHGLRHITSGYWVLVREFTHKETVKEITHLTNVTTNLGRGRAWMYSALSDQLLESYLRCFVDNNKLVRRHYVKEALVLDQQCMQILMTLSAGLEHITFSLNMDVPYLDLASHVLQPGGPQPARPQVWRREDSDDRLSLCSMDSSVSSSQNITVTEETPQSVVEVCDGSHCNSNDSLVASLNQTPPREDVLASNCEANTNLLNEPRNFTLPIEDPSEKSRISRISKITCMHPVELDMAGDTLEVIHVKKIKRKTLKKKKVPTATLR